MRKIITIVVLTAFALGCKTSNKSSSEGNTLNIPFQAKSGSKVAGNAVFTEKGNKVTVTANLSGLKPGTHAIHIHEKADCSAADASSAGGHWNPTFKNHGKWGSAAYHRGDIGNFTTDEFGNGTITLSTDEWCIGCGDPTRDIIGKGLIVHEGSDDYTTQPTGNAGGRVACSAIIR
ncbi:MAG TPA: superoxide dismutase family protein [Flavobacterium sp.]|jgi:Cu-Zn family superoxide dismutase